MEKIAYEKKAIKHDKLVLSQSTRLGHHDADVISAIINHTRLLKIHRRVLKEARGDYADWLAQQEALLAAAQPAPVISSSSGSSGGYYLCGLQIDPRWTDGTWGNYNVTCGDKASQIAAAEGIAQGSGGDPWPNCPDPYDGSGGTWDDTNQCENSGRW